MSTSLIEKFIKCYLLFIQNIYIKTRTFQEATFYCQTQKTLNTWKFSGMLIVYWPIIIKFRIRKQTSKPQTNYRCCSQFSYLMPYWLILTKQEDSINISGVHGFESFTVITPCMPNKNNFWLLVYTELYNFSS